MVLVVQKWIFGKLTLKIPLLLHTAVLSKDNLDVKELIVVITLKEKDIKENVIKMVVISTHTEWEVKTSMEKDHNLQLILPKNSHMLLNSLLLMEQLMEI